MPKVFGCGAPSYHVVVVDIAQDQKTQSAPAMPPYDSDSSDGEDNYTETNVLLGYASTEPTSDPISHIGGQPVCSHTDTLRRMD